MPELERAEDERSAARGVNGPWDAVDEAVAVAAVCACRNKAAYNITARNLLDAIMHAPSYSASSKPTLVKHTDNCVRALELKIVTKMLGGYEGWKPRVPMGFHGLFRKDDMMIRWGESVKIIQPYAKRMKEKKSHLDKAQLMNMLGRQDRTTLDFAIIVFLNEPTTVVREQKGEAPINEKNLSEVISLYCAMRDKQPRTRGEACRRLYEILWRE